MITPKVSIVVPVYNVEKYLKKCMESLSGQTLTDIEVICVNDGSTDNSLKIILEYVKADSRFKVIDKENTGYGDSVNRGIEQALGEYIGIVESDDFAEPDMFEKLYARASAFQCDIVKGNYRFYWKHRTPHSAVNEILRECPYNQVLNPLEHLEIFDVPASVWSAIYKRDFLRKKKIVFLPTPGASYQDLSFTFKAFAFAERVYFIEDEIMNYRYDNPESSVHNANKIFCVCDEFQEIERILNKEFSENRELAGKLSYVKFKAYLWNYERLALPYQYVFLLRMYDEFMEAWKENRLCETQWKGDFWEHLQQLLENREEFFRRTCRDYADTRVQLYPTYNRKLELYGLEKLLEGFEEIYIYGAGKVCREVLAYLKRTEHFHQVRQIWVTDVKGNAGSVEGIPVKAFPVDGTLAVKGLVLVAIQEKAQKEILERLVDARYEKILLITGKIRKSMGEWK